MSSDQCTIGPDGKLKDAKDIDFYNDPDDKEPLPRPPPRNLLFATVFLSTLAIHIRTNSSFRATTIKQH
jgi:hypothetical protein